MGNNRLNVGTPAQGRLPWLRVNGIGVAGYYLVPEKLRRRDPTQRRNTALVTLLFRPGIEVPRSLQRCILTASIPHFLVHVTPMSNEVNDNLLLCCFTGVEHTVMPDSEFEHT